MLSVCFRKKKRPIWFKNLILQVDKFGAYHQLLQELKIESRIEFSNFIKIPHQNSEILVQKIGPLVSKHDTKFHFIIPVVEKLVILRFSTTDTNNVILTV